jgi:hypothetical protein
MVRLTKTFREVWSFPLFEIILSVNENGQGPYIEAHSTRVYLWENIPASPMAFTTPEFFVIKSNHDTYWSRWDLYVYHIPSMRHWECRHVSSPATFLDHILRRYMCRCPPDTTCLSWISGVFLQKIGRR